MTMNDDMNSTQNAQTTANRFAIYLDPLGNLRTIEVGQTETEESLQYHFRGTVGYNQRIIGFFGGNDAQPKKYQIGTLDDAQESAILLGCENAKLRAKAEKYDQLIKDLGVEMRDQNGTIWGEAKRLKDENKRLELEKVILRHALIQIHDGYNELGPIDPVEIARIALASIHQ